MVEERAGFAVITVEALGRGRVVVDDVEVMACYPVAGRIRVTVRSAGALISPREARGVVEIIRRFGGHTLRALVGGTSASDRGQDVVFDAGFGAAGIGTRCPSRLSGQPFTGGLPAEFAEGVLRGCGGRRAASFWLADGGSGGVRRGELIGVDLGAGWRSFAGCHRGLPGRPRCRKRPPRVEDDVVFRRAPGPLRRRRRWRRPALSVQWPWTPADGVTGLDLLGARRYEPATGRFLSLDPVFEAGDPHRACGRGHGILLAE